jgi:hypothetical protein
MMRIKKISFIDEVKDQLNDSIDVGIEFENGYSYTISVRTPDDSVEEMLQEGTNFIKPGTPVIVVKQLTKKTVNEAIEAYAEDEGYWLKLCQFGDELDISIFNKLEAQHREDLELFELEGLDRLFYYIQKYLNIPSDNRVLIGPIFFLILVSLIAYYFFKLGLLDFFFNFIN